MNTLYFLMILAFGIFIGWLFSSPVKDSDAYWKSKHPEDDDWD